MKVVLHEADRRMIELTDALERSTIGSDVYYDGDTFRVLDRQGSMMRVRRTVPGVGTEEFTLPRDARGVALKVALLLGNVRA